MRSIRATRNTKIVDHISKTGKSELMVQCRPDWMAGKEKLIKKPLWLLSSVIFVAN